MFGLADIPVEVILDKLLPLLPIRDVLSLASTNKAFSTLGEDDTFWKRRLQSDFNFSGQDTARTSGWKFIYKRISYPKIYVWGEKSKGRLGLTKIPKVSIPDVPYPIRLHIPGVRIVSMCAGGTSFHALDSEGGVYVWGTLDGTSFTLRSDGYSEPGQKATTPFKLQLPTRIRSISCGRLHSSMLDEEDRVLTFLSWARPFSITAPVSRPIQVECGWSFSAILTKSADVFIWWPFSEEVSTSLRERCEEQGGSQGIAHDGTIPCVIYEPTVPVVLLPALPSLPDLQNETTETATQLIRIAGLDRQIVGLTNKGHVLIFSSLEDESSASLGSWKYLAKFTELQRVREHSAFSSESALEPPDSLKITHISAQFRTFVAYSTGASSIVLMGNTETTEDSDASIVRALQNNSVISVVLGDYHYGALTSTGKFMTWGAYSKGALGLGDPAYLPVGTPGAFQTDAERLRSIERGIGPRQNVEIPTQVRFDHRTRTSKERFCISAVAAGWHTGALVIDLESDDEEEIDEEEQSTDLYFGPPLPVHEPGIPIFPGRRGLFRGVRIGYAGRGIIRGGQPS